MEWRDVKGYEGIYQVSNNGNIRSLDKYCKSKDGKYSRLVKGKEITQRYDKDGYLRAELCHMGTEKTVHSHRVVAEAFIPNPNNYPVVNHINEIKDDNRVENLEWCTVKYNNTYGSRHRMLVPVCQYNLDGTFIRDYSSLKEAQDTTGISYNCISECCKRSGTAGGFIWKYKNN